MLRKIDELYFRIKDAWQVLTKPNYFDDVRAEAKKIGKFTGQGEILRVLNEHDPSQFENQHFKLGYYYAHETAKKVFHADRNPMA